MKKVLFFTITYCFFVFNIQSQNLVLKAEILNSSLSLHDPFFISFNLINEIKDTISIKYTKHEPRPFIQFLENGEWITIEKTKIKNELRFQSKSDKSKMLINGIGFKLPYYLLPESKKEIKEIYLFDEKDKFFTKTGLYKIRFGFDMKFYDDNVHNLQLYSEPLEIEVKENKKLDKAAYKLIKKLKIENYIYEGLFINNYLSLLNDDKNINMDKEKLEYLMRKIINKFPSSKYSDYYHYYFFQREMMSSPNFEDENYLIPDFIYKVEVFNKETKQILASFTPIKDEIDYINKYTKSKIKF